MSSSITEAVSEQGHAISDLIPKRTTGPLTFADLRFANVTRCNAVFHHLQTWSPTDWACAMAGECGEACNNVKKLRRLDDGDKPYNAGIDRTEITRLIGEELADVVIYVDLLAARLGINLAEAVRDKFNVVSNRVGSGVRIASTEPR